MVSFPRLVWVGGLVAEWLYNYALYKKRVQIQIRTAGLAPNRRAQEVT